ncbi:MAG: MFS transporter [Thermomicrobiales bacterium]
MVATRPAGAAPTRRQVNRVMGIYVCYQFLSNFGLGVFALLFNLYLRKLGLREDFIGLFNALSTLSWAAGALVVGPLSRRIGARAILIGGVFLFAIVAAFQIVVTASVGLLGVAVSLGLSSAAMTVPSTPYVFTLIPPERRTQGQALVFSAIALSTAAGAFMGGALPGLLGGDTVHNFRITMAISVALTLGGIVPLSILRTAREQPDAPNRGAMTPFTRVERRQCRRDNLAFALVGGFMALGTGMLIPFYNVYLSSLGASPGAVGTLFSVSSLVGGVMSLGAPLIARRLPPLPAVAVLRSISVPMALMVGLGLTGLPFAGALYAIRTIGTSLSWPIESSTIGNIIEPRNRVSLFGMRSAAWNGGLAISSWAGGAIIVHFGYRPVHLLYVLAYAAAMGLFLAYWPRRVRRAHEERQALAERAALQPA